VGWRRWTWGAGICRGLIQSAGPCPERTPTPVRGPRVTMVPFLSSNPPIERTASGDTPGGGGRSFGGPGVRSAAVHAGATEGHLPLGATAVLGARRSALRLGVGPAAAVATTTAMKESSCGVSGRASSALGASQIDFPFAFVHQGHLAADYSTGANRCVLRNRLVRFNDACVLYTRLLRFGTKLVFESGSQRSQRSRCDEIPHLNLKSALIRQEACPRSLLSTARTEVFRRRG
jgi:hypothetical protein